MTTLLISGSRAATPAMLDYAVRAVERAKTLEWVIVVGDAEGVDQQVIYKACWLDVPFTFYGITPYPRHDCCQTHLSNYQQIPGDYLNRDRHMVRLADVVLAIWNGASRGTKYTYDYAVAQGKTAYLRQPGRVIA